MMRVLSTVSFCDSQEILQKTLKKARSTTQSVVGNKKRLPDLSSNRFDWEMPRCPLWGILPTFRLVE
jgi:hypothetical protein